MGSADDGWALSGRIGKVVASHANVARSIPGEAEAAPIYTMYEALDHEVLPMRVGDATSKLELPCLMALSVAGCGRLQLGVLHWATSVDYCK